MRLAPELALERHLEALGTAGFSVTTEPGTWWVKSAGASWQQRRNGVMESQQLPRRPHNAGYGVGL
jgi:hypothetical protein